MIDQRVAEILDADPEGPLPYVVTRYVPGLSLYHHVEEEGVLAGGFGSAVWEELAEGGPTPRILRVGLPDRFVTHGAPALLQAEVGFTPERIAERIQSAVLDPRGSLASA